MPLSSILSSCTLVLVLACTMHAADQTITPDNGALVKMDADFIAKAASGGLFEVRSSELALKRGVLTDDEKAFAKMMVSDHSAVNKELEKLAAAKGITVSDTLMPKQQKLLDDLGKADDKKLAATYLDDQVSAHDQTIDLFKKASTDCHDADLRTFAGDKLPTLREHAERAKALAKIR